mgnify:CR=1 FL=1
MIDLQYVVLYVSPFVILFHCGRKSGRRKNGKVRGKSKEKHIDIRLKCQPIGKADMGFEFQSRYIALRIRAGGNPLVVRDAVWRLFHLSKSQRQ